ncbi:MAG: hypothetical protein CMO01_29345 [Thalassobius sp.]|nr:hypothetical protein [Thalassovita sp.]
MKAFLCILFLFQSTFVLAKASLIIHVEQIDAFSIIDEVELNIDGEHHLKKFKSYFVEFDNLDKGTYTLTFKSITGTRFQKEIEIKKHKKYKLEYSLDDFFIYLSDESSLSETFFKQENGHLIIYNFTAIGCLDRKKESIVITKQDKDVKITLLPEFNAMQSNNDYASLQKTVVLENVEIINAFLHFEKVASKQSTDACSFTGISGGSMSSTLIFLGDKMVRYDYCPQDFTGFDELKESIKDEW